MWANLFLNDFVLFTMQITLLRDSFAVSSAYRQNLKYIFLTVALHDLDLKCSCSHFYWKLPSFFAKHIHYTPKEYKHANYKNDKINQ